MRIVLAVAGSILTGAYWWAVFITVYAGALFSGDRDPAAPPAADEDVVIRNAAVILVGILLYALLSMLWRRVTERLDRRRGGRS